MVTKMLKALLNKLNIKMLSKSWLFPVEVPLKMKGKNMICFSCCKMRGSVILENQTPGLQCIPSPHLVRKFPFSCALFCKSLGLERGRSPSLHLRTQPLNFSPGWL